MPDLPGQPLTEPATHTAGRHDAGAVDVAALGFAVIGAAREMHAQGLVVSTVGNVSARCGVGMLITPTRRRYDELLARDLFQVGIDGTPLNPGTGVISSEWRLHAAVYAARTDVGAVVHTHSPHATAWSFQGRALTLETEERRYFGLGDIEVASFAPGGTTDLADAVVCALGSRPAVLLARHGVLAVGPTPLEALEMCAVVERQAQVEYLVRMDERRG